ATVTVGVDHEDGTLTDAVVAYTANGTIINTYAPDAPSFEKKIKDVNDTTGETSDWQDSADYDIGDSVPYKLTATLPSDVSEYYKYHITFHDVMENTLNFNRNSVVVKVNGKETTEYTLVGADQSQVFDLTLTWEGQKDEETGDYTAKVPAGVNNAVVTVEFTAKLNENANIGSRGNINTAYLRYSNSPEYTVGDDGKIAPNEETDTTKKDAVIAFTYEVDINKVTGGKALPGAAFTLYKKIKDVDEPQKIKTIKNTEGNKFEFIGLDDGTYVLEETGIPVGYKAIDPITFEVTAAHTVSWDVQADTDTGFDALADQGGNGRNTVLTALTGTETTADKTEGKLTFVPDLEKGSLTADVNNEEAEKPSFEKKIADVNDSTEKALPEDLSKIGEEQWQDSADHDIDDHVPYRLKAVLADNVSDYYKYHITFDDVLEQGLTLDANSIKVYLGNTDITAEDYVEITPDGTDSTDKFSVTVSWEAEKTDGRYDSRLASSLNKAVVYVYFTATLNENAIFGNVGNVNTASLKYSNNSNLLQEGDAGYTSDEDKPHEDEGEEGPDSVIAFTYKVDISKVDEGGDALTGAEFKLEKKIKGDSADSWAEIDRVTVKDNVFSFKGLDDGEYRLTETKVPDNHTAVDPIGFTVTAVHNAEWDGKENTRTTILSSLTGDVKDGVIELEADTAKGRLVGDVVNDHKPEIEKYVNKDVHSDLEAFDTEFTYDIIAYVTKDADSFEIVDELVPAVEFVSEEKDVVVRDLGETVDHIAATGSVTEKGADIETEVKVSIKEKKLTVSVEDAESLRGHYVRVTFDARFDPEVIDSLAAYMDNKEAITDNGLAISEIESHEGVPNTASYTVTVDNKAKYEETSNTVTVTPSLEAEGVIELEAEKRFKDGNLDKVKYTFDVFEAVTSGDSYAIAKDENGDEKEPLFSGQTEKTADAEKAEVTFDYGKDEEGKALDGLTFTQDDLAVYDEDGKITDYKKEANFDYIIREHVPEDAEAIIDGKAVAYKDADDKQKAAGGFIKDNVVYDNVLKVVHVKVTDNGGKLEVETVTKDGKPATAKAKFENKWDKVKLKLNKTGTNTTTAGTGAKVGVTAVQTGDPTNFPLLFGVLIAGVVLLIVALVLRKKVRGTDTDETGGEE
ncbi:MAG: isopeptide-forming domain-containing fimbrial protein, partial [Eubacterium sp.]|nr:isopeptide-forming domain-containing fimbrial protein [Eubacterium sp.]